jgi:hypothetical protein
MNLGRPRKPIAIKTAPAIISQWGNPIDESRPIYFPPFTLSRSLDQVAGIYISPAGAFSIGKTM